MPRKLLRSAALAGMVATLTSCIVVPIGDTSEQQMNYATAPLLDMADGRLAYLLQECTKWYAVEKTPACEHPKTYLAVRPAGWDLATEARALLSKPAVQFDDVYSIKASSYSRPPLASHGVTEEFVGYFAGTGLVWVHPASPETSAAVTENSRLVYDTLNLPNDMLFPTSPALVVRDGSAVWVFVERSTPCNEDLCFSLPETLGLAADVLPENLRHSFMLYYQDLKQGNQNRLERVIPADLSRYLRYPVLPLPRPGLPYAFDFSTAPTRPILRLESQLQCATRTSKTDYLAIGFIPPHVVGSNKSYRLTGCTRPAQSQTERSDPSAPPPSAEAPANYPDDPPFPRDSSSYYCHPAPLPGQAQFGQGSSGCGFTLRAPQSGQALPNTPYLIWLFNPKKDGIELGIEGITDAQGRTAYIRSSTPITHDRMRVSRRLLPREKSTASTPIADKAGNINMTDVASGVGFDACRSMSGRRYHMTVCTGQRYEDITDDHAWTMAYDVEKGKSCPTQYLFEAPAW
jgi:hypothetical protein